MPGLKRSRGSTEQSSDDEVRSSHSGESLFNDKGKRRRLSAEGEDNNSEDLTDEETLNIQATQFHQWQIEKPIQNNQAQENGIIESITCTNFMCHDYLQVDVGPLINFIIGHNGSGKSAVLTALTVCLGGKASATNRAGSLKAFVKAGKESCTVAVKIKNQGETAYQSLLYGDTIVVERTFNISGSSGFKLKSASGRIISTKRGDLEEITDFYALQLDNPLSVLTQDNARQFLNASSPADKYRFFMKGVQLEQLNQDYELLQESIQQVENTFEDKQVHISQLEEKKRKAESNWNALERAANIRNEINIQRVKMAWSQVEDQEKLLHAHEKELEVLGAKLETALGEVRATTEALNQKDQEHAQLSDQVQGHESELAVKNDEKKEEKSEFDTVKSEMATAHREQRQIGESIKRAKENVIKSQKDIQDETHRLEEVHGGSHSRLLMQLEQRRNDMKEARNRVEDHRADLPRLEEMHTKAKSAFDEQNDRRRAKERDLKACESRLSDLRQQGNQRSGFPQNTDALIKAIAQDSGFREKPIGPVGHYIQLTEPIWGSILEKSLGAALNAYVVTSKADQNKLNAIMHRVNCKCPVFIGNHESFSTAAHEPDARFSTVLRVLQINNDLIKRQLIINQGIEQTVLIEDQKEARRTMHEERLKNVKQCFSINANHDGCGIRFSYGQGKSMKSDPIDAYRGKSRIKTQTEDQISFEENQRQRLKTDLTRLESDMRNLQTAAENCRKTIARHKKLANDLKIEAQRVEQDVEQLQIDVDNETVEEGRLDALRVNLRTAEDEKESLERMYEDAVVDRDKQDAKLANIKRRLDSIDSDIKVMHSAHRSATSLRNKVSDERHKVLLQKNQACEREASLKAKQDESQVMLRETSDTVADWSTKAAGVGPRVPISPGETSESIEKKLLKLDDEVKLTEQRAGGDRRKLAEARKVTTKNYEEALRQFHTERKLADLLKQSLATRRERWGHFRKKIVARARCTFLHVLSERSFNGKLKVDHKARKLEIEIQPDETQKNKQGRETTTLSGGEKSYSTICLLLSLWDAVGTPIRCLDEFDVFMDSVNRDISMKLIIKSARNSIGRQFILISPQAGIADRSRDVKIIRMRDPERNQTRLHIESS